MNRAFTARTAIFLLTIASIPAVAADAGAQPAPWRGSQVTYGHSASAYTFNRAAEPYYNPTWGHRLELRPQWTLGDALYLRGRFELAQEFTQSDLYNTAHELAWSDFFFDVGTPGWQEPLTGIRVGGSVRFVAGISKASLRDTRLTSIGPGLSVSRTFGVLSGLTVAYDARYTQRFHRFTTRQNAGPTLNVCFDPAQPLECSLLQQTGVANAWGDVSQALLLAFSPVPSFGVSASFSLGHVFTYDVAPSEFDGRLYQPREDRRVRYPWAFGLEASWRLPVFRGLSLSTGAVTSSEQLAPSSQRQSPFFNRNTQLYLELGVDLEGLFSKPAPPPHIQ